MNESSRLGPSMGAIVMVALAMAPAPAEAHLNSTGMGPIYDGFLHFLTSPDDLVPALALALLAGLRGAHFGRRALFVLPTAWLLGGSLGLTAAPTNVAIVGTAISFLLLGGLVAADVKLSLRAITALAILLGLCHGFLNGSGMGHSGTAIIALLGWVWPCLFWSRLRRHRSFCCALSGRASPYGWPVAGSPPAGS
jgi:hydrogenase/urease accessory protein HupE